MITPYRHRNVTAKRLLLDAYQFFRAQSFVVGQLGRQFSTSRDYAEIEITYKCNLKCINCNRSCAQAPSDLEMPVSDVENFVAQSIEKKLAGDESEFWAESRRSIVVFLISLIVCFVIKRRLTPP